MFTQKYHWFDDFYFTATVDNKGKQTLQITIKDEDGCVKDSKKLRCIHTAISKITPERAAEYRDSAIELTDIIDAESMEAAKEIQLNSEEAFKAFKSWVAGIAEMGIEALVVQIEIESLAKFSYPIATPLLKFTAKHNFECLILLIERIAEICWLGNAYHESSLKANFVMINKILSTLTAAKRLKILQHILSCGFPGGTVFNAFKRFRSTLVRLILDQGDPDMISQVYPFMDSSHMEAFARLPNGSLFEEYASLIHNGDYRVRRAVAANPNAVKLEEYTSLIDDGDYQVQRAVAANPNAVKLEEYTSLIYNGHRQVRQAVAANPNAVKLEEYTSLIHNGDYLVRQTVAANPNAVKLEEYTSLIHDIAFQVQRAVAANPNAVKLEEYTSLIHNGHFRVRQAVAANPNAVKLEEYSILVTDEEPVVRESIALNPEAIHLKNFSLLLSDSYPGVRAYIFFNPAAAKIDGLLPLVIEKVQGLKTRKIRKILGNYSSFIKPEESLVSDYYEAWRFGVVNKSDSLNYLQEMSLFELNKFSKDSKADEFFCRYIKNEVEKDRIETIKLFEQFQARLPEVRNTYGLCQQTGTPLSKMYKYLVPKICYTPPYIVKKIPKRRGGFRTLQIPYTGQMRIQRWILDNILIRVTPHQCAHGFIPEKSTKTNAAPHVGKKLIIKMDLKNFFPSIRQDKVFRVFLSLGYTREFALILSHLCTVCYFTTFSYIKREWRRKNRPDKARTIYNPTTTRFLPQGGPASPYLSNLAFYEADIDLKKLCDKHEVSYTRYADDLTFSTNNQSFATSKFISEVFRIVVEHGFGVNKKKTKVLRPNMQQRVCGLVVNSSIHVPRKFHNQIRGMLHRAETYDFDNSEVLEEYKNKLLGMISYVHGIQAAKSEKYMERFNEIEWRVRNMN